MNGIVLAGGRATRLGPLAAQMNKSLVTVGQRPMLVHQVLQLQRAGCIEVIVVVSPDQERQVRDVVKRAGLPNVHVTQQPRAAGPADALLHGVHEVHDEGDVIVLLADTFLEDEDLPSEAETVVVAPAPVTRRWCGWQGSRYVDDLFLQGQHVLVGAYRFASAEDVHRAITAGIITGREGEFEMAEFLNAYRRGRLREQVATTWRDVGDLAALAHARRENNITRSFNELQVSNAGLVTKVTPNRAECRFMHEVRHQQRDGRPLGTLYPTVYDAKFDSYTVEHVDLPTLAELWLYWPGGVDVWTHIIGTLLHKMRAFHWNDGLEVDARPSFKLAHERWKSWSHPIQREDPLIINGRKLQAGNLLINRLVHDLERQEWGSARAHGDLNFTNVLWSLATSNFKLLDPRGDVHYRGYDLAKLRYSWNGGFPAITHGLFDVEGEGDTWNLNIWPDRTEEGASLDKLLGSLHGLDALLMLNGAALHTGDEQLALYLRAVEVANE